MAEHLIANLSKVTPIRGVSYSPVPSDDKPAPPQKYFDTDFTNSSFPLIWSADAGGRGDIKNLADIGVNFVHLYDWSVPPDPGQSPGDYQRNHLPFLKECGKQGVKAFVPISNYFIEQIHNGNHDTVKLQIHAMVKEVYDGKAKPLDGAGMWGVANEYDLATHLFNVNDVATAMAYILDAETKMGIAASDALPVTSPVSFAQPSNTLPPGIKAIQELENAIKANSTLGDNFWKTRFVASTNPFNSGEFLKTYIDTSFPNHYPDLPFFFAEMGINTSGATPPDEAGQAAWVKKQLEATVLRKNFLGTCVFQFLDQSAMKSGSEATFGMTKYSGSDISQDTIEPADYVPGGGDTYAVDTLLHKPLWDTLKAAY